jgi:hypothetical protein
MRPLERILNRQATLQGNVKIHQRLVSLVVPHHFTVTVTLEVAAMEELAESAPVTVNVYVPAVVAGVLLPPPPVVDPPPPPPHPIAPATTTIPNSTIIRSQSRRRAGTPTISSPASITPPPPRPISFSPLGASMAVLDAAVVRTVNTVVPLPPLVTVTLVGLRLHVGKLCAPAGEAVSVQLRFIVPE